MNPIHVGKGVTICRIAILLVFLATIGFSTCFADQLQWNSLSVCEEAAQAIRQESLLISYCSQANEDYVELWLVRGLKVVHTPVPNLFEVLVLAKCLYSSHRALSSEEFPTLDEDLTLNEVRDPRWFVEEIDLAYVYIHVGGSSFHCLGEVLALECLVGVETISLHADVMEKIMPRTSSGLQINLQSFDVLPARPQ